MAKYPMTEVIAHREYEFTGSEGHVSVVASIGRPALMPDAPYGDWYCPLRIAGPQIDRESYVGGVDSVQALLLAISMMRVELQLIALHGSLTWLEQGDLGLTLAPENCATEQPAQSDPTRI